MTIRDNGRGIPVDPHPKFPNLSALEVILTTLHSGGKFTSKVYETSGGLHGVGISVVNALSDSLDVEICRNRQLWQQSYSRGKSIAPLACRDTPTSKKGTSIRFHPDPEIFGDQLHFKASTLYQMARAKAYLFKGVEILWSCDAALCNEKTPAEAKLHYPAGLVDYLQDSVEGIDTIAESLFSGDAAFPQGKGRVEWAVAWPTTEDETTN